MQKTRRIIAVVTSALVAVGVFLPAQAASAATVTAASAVRSISVADAWSADSPKAAKAKITWVRPAATYGANLIGYRIEKSADKTTWSLAFSNTMSSATSAVVSTGLVAGAPNYFRVKAITRKGSTTKIGSASAVATKVLTAAPKSPVLLGLTKITAIKETHSVRWLKATELQAGATQFSYKAIATSTSGAQKICEADALATTCDLTGLTVGTTYKLQLFLKNLRAETANVDELVPADSSFSLQWYLGTSNGVAATRAWTATKGSSNVVVAVLDSGIVSHPELQGQLVAGYDFISNAKESGDGDGRDADPTDVGDAEGNWHGTHVAGIIAAKSDSVGITGIAPGVKLQPIRVIGPDGGSTDDLIDAMRWAAGLTVAGVPDNKTPAKIINMSLVSESICYSNSAMQRVVNEVQNKGVIIVTASGNTAENNYWFTPTGCLGPFSVGASGFAGDITYYSNYNSDLLAPGGDDRKTGGDVSGANGQIYSLWNPTKSNGYISISGTSMAAPIVTGIIALMISIRPLATREQIAEAILNSATPFSSNTTCSIRPEGYCGEGIVNAATAIEALIAAIG